MSERQYVGARYVPKFYENPNGTAEWKANVPYEAMTIVTYLGNSYTSKIPVPPESEAPDTDTLHWVLTGNFNEQVEKLTEKTKYRIKEFSYLRAIQNGQINEGDIIHTNGFYEENDGGSGYYKISSSGFISIQGLYAIPLESVVNPEMLGAYGNGENDDTSVINYMMNNFRNVEMHKRYKVSTIMIENKQIYTLHAENSYIISDTTAVTIKNCKQCTFYFGQIEGTTGILIDGSEVESQYLNIYFEIISAADNCIHCLAKNNFWTNEIRLYDGRFFKGTNGLLIENKSTQELNGFYLNNIGFEGMANAKLSNAITIDNETKQVTNIKINACRFIENADIIINHKDNGKFVAFVELDNLKTVRESYFNLLPVDYEIYTNLFYYKPTGVDNYAFFERAHYNNGAWQPIGNYCYNISTSSTEPYKCLKIKEYNSTPITYHFTVLNGTTIEDFTMRGSTSSKKPTLCTIDLEENHFKITSTNSTYTLYTITALLPLKSSN